MDDNDRALAVTLGWQDKGAEVAGWVWVEDAAGMVVAESYREFVYAAEAEIVRRGLLSDYAGAVMDILGVSCYGAGGGDAWASTDEIGLVLTAPPDVRVRAMLAALGVAVVVG